MRYMCIIFISLFINQWAFAQGEAVSAGVTENPDGSFTITEPKILIDNKEFPIAYSNQFGEGICAFFGFDSFLHDNYFLEPKIVYLFKVASGSKVSEVAQFDYYGSYEGIVKDDYFTQEVTCYNKRDLKIVGISSGINYNYSDYSAIITEPKILRGNKELFASMDPQALCHLHLGPGYTYDIYSYKPNIFYSDSPVPLMTAWFNHDQTKVTAIYFLKQSIREITCNKLSKKPLYKR